MTTVVECKNSKTSGHGKQGKSMDMRSHLGAGLILAASTVAVVVSHHYPSRAYASLPSPYALDPASDEATAMLGDGRLLTLRDGVLELDGKRIALTTPRRFASLTTMPTGQVLVWGGIDNEGRLIETGEWFEPSTGALVTTGRLGLPPRAGHTLNVLSDGTLAMTGGWGEGNVPAHDVALWRPLDRRLTVENGEQEHARFQGKAELLANGGLRVSGGVDETGRPIHQTWNFDRHEAAASVRKPRGVAASYPVRDRTDASPIGPLALRFDEPVDVAQLSGSVSLLGPNGVVKTRVVGAENGRLAFVQLPDELYPSARYTIFVQGLHTAKGQSVPYDAIGFTTKAARNGVVLAGEGKRPGTPESSTAEPPLFVMAGQGKVKACKPADAFHLCRDKGLVRDGAFYPGQDNVATSSGGHWRLYRDRQELPDTRALEANLSKGDTALIGQVRRIDETPVANVAIQVDGQTVRTDARGVFVLSHLRSGRRELFVDGGPAGTKGVEYGRFVVGADVTASKVNHMPYVMYLPRVLDRDKIALPSPTTRETVLTHPDMPGLELRIPAGAVFRDRNGKVLNEIAIVPTPVDHAPFPLPDNFPMYFTIQPGDAVVQGMTPEAAKGIQVVYPNYGKQKPADRADFWVYTADKGWEMYGAGHVSADASQLVADKDTRLVWALGAGASTNPLQESNGRKPGDKCAADPVDLKTGQFINRWHDLTVADVMPLTIDRTATNLPGFGSPFGRGTGSPLSITLSSQSGFDKPRLVLPCGEAIDFHVVSGQPVWPLVGTVWRHTETQSEFYGATLQFLNDTTPEGAHWIVTLKDGSQYWFNRHAPNNLYRRVDRHGNYIQYIYNAGLLSQMVSPNGRVINIAYNNNNLIGSVSDQIGRIVHYEYEKFTGHESAFDGWLLKRVTYPDGTNEEYTHWIGDGVQTWIIESLKDRSGTVQFTNQFESKLSAVVIGQVYTDGSSTKIEYERSGPDNSIMATVVTDQNGHKERTEFDPVSGYPAVEVLAYGTSAAQTRKIERASSGLVMSKTDVAGRRTIYDRDGNGNVIKVTRMPGTTDQSVISYTYTVDSRIASVTDALGHTTSMNYNEGCLESIVDATGRAVHFTCDVEGRMTSVANDDGSAYVFQYNGADLVSIKDPSGNITRFVYDAVGRRVAVVSADGAVTQFAFDANDRVISVVDGEGKEATYTYDAMGDLTNVLLPNGSELKFSYDSMGHQISTTDALGRIQKFGYDPKGNLISHEDRKHQVTTVSYNDIDLPVLKTFADGSGISYAYGPNNRPIEALDTSSGSIQWSYDAYDRVSAEKTHSGTISYLYDAAGRRISMSTTGGQSLTYDYDDGDRITAIHDGAKSYGFEYDEIGRRSVLTYPNGLAAHYTYGTSGNLENLEYRNASGSVISDSSYGYDSAGRRVTQSGNASSMVLAESSGDRQYDSADRLMSTGQSTYSYDESGNLTSDGAQLFEWNARNQLVGVSEGGENKLSFSYDALGRRTSKVSDVEKKYWYDGMTEVAETIGGTSYQLISSGLIDEKLSRTSADSQEYFLVDGRGSLTAVADELGSIFRRYEYDAFGRTEGASSSSESRYLFAGRELDGDDLYYYRSRYYRPSHGRFISEDSWGLAAGQLNAYQYVGDSPINYTDPSGHCPWCVGAIVGGVIGGVFGYFSADDGNRWSGAAAGALAGGVSGATGAWLGEAAGLLGGRLGGLLGASLAKGATTSAFGAVSGVAGNVMGNIAGNKPPFKRAGYAAALGAAIPFMSGEAGWAASGIESLTGDAIFGGLSGTVGGIGGMLDPLGDCAKPEPPTPLPDNHFPWASMSF